MPDDPIRNVGIWVDEEGKLQTKEFFHLPEPQGAETLVQVLYSGINPADTKHGILLGIRNTVSGYDFSGTVIKSGHASKFQPGDRIAGCTPSGLGRPPCYGTHQDYILVPDSMAFLVAENLPPDHAACLAISTRTAADALFNLLGYPLMTQDTAEGRREALLIWGGASSLGYTAIQFAKAISVQHIFTTASPSNHAALKELGATEVFDYKDPNVVNKVQETALIKGVHITRVFDAIGNPQQKTVDLAAQCANEEALVVTSTIHPKYRMPVASMETDFMIQPPGRDVITVPARVEDSVRATQALHWVVENYQSGFRIPRVHILSVTAQEALSYLEDNAANGSRFGKSCIQHPFVR